MVYTAQALQISVGSGKSHETAKCENDTAAIYETPEILEKSGGNDRNEIRNRWTAQCG